ncbi:hypothetical protein JXA02_12170, partial [candidate division KSB1 bacterium]|nr:hypothetical protein [candidate division KSB1 bacterium]
RHMRTITISGGRVDNIGYAADGRAVVLGPIFKGDLPILEAQIIQASLDRVTIRYVLMNGHKSADLHHILRQRIQERMGEVHVFFESVPLIPRGPNGKFPLVITHVPTERLLAKDALYEHAK